MLYARLKKALYGCLRSGLLFWKYLSENLQRSGFRVNGYDTCVANKLVKGKQCTIVWHVDDLKISHVDKTVVTEVIESLSKEYGDLRVTRGKIHEYLGMTLDFSEAKKIKVKMLDYVKKILDESDPRHKGISVTPATNNLFNIKINSPYIDKTSSQFFTRSQQNFFFSQNVQDLIS